MRQIKITVMRKVCHRDLMERYENPIEHACDLQEGQVFVALAHGASDLYDGWMKNPHSAMVSCNDGFRPVSFLVEVVE